jgi:ketose-bisphosphate aldolase
LTFVTLGEILQDCRAQGWAVPGFDVVDTTTVEAALRGAAAQRAPVILMVYPHHTPPARWPGLVALVRTEAARAGVPVCMHLDHGSSLEQVRAALEAGFSSVMIDASRSPLEENIALTRRVVDLAHVQGASVEAELGHVGQGTEVLSADEEARRLTRVEDAARFVAETDVDALAVAIGTVHGLYRGEPHLDFERLRALGEAVSLPLVLHGGSGTPDADLRRAIAGGICKVNVWTEVAHAMVAALKDALAGPVAQSDLPRALAAGRAAAQALVEEKIHLFGAAGRAP